jgi:hypothetical protein
MGYKLPGVIYMKVIKALYGLLNSAQDWYAELKTIMESLGYRRAKYDFSLFIHTTKFVMISYHVDDGYVIGKGSEIESELDKINEIVELKRETGENGVLLGKRIKREADGTISISQAQEIDDFVNDYKNEVSGGKCVASPLTEKLELRKSEPHGIVNKNRYQSKTGSLVWYSQNIRHDIKFAANYLSRWNSCNTTVHDKEIDRTLKYLKKSSGLGVKFRKTYNKTDIFKNLVMYVDSDHAGCLDTRKSVSGVLIGYLTNDNIENKIDSSELYSNEIDRVAIGNKVVPLLSMSKKQGVTADSSHEAEFVALSDGGKELKFIRMLLADMLNKEHEKQVGTPTYIDNQAAYLNVTNVNKPPSKLNKYIDIKFHRAKDDYECGMTDLREIDTTVNPADLFTKPTGPIIHCRHTMKIMDHIDV